MILWSGSEGNLDYKWDFVGVHYMTVYQGFTVLQRAKKVMSDSPGLVDFATRLVFFVLNLPDRQVLSFLGNSNYRRIVIYPANKKGNDLWASTC